MKSKVFLVLFFISAGSFADDAVSRLGTSTPILAKDYCAFLNQNASSDPLHFYDEKMSVDLEGPCVLRLGTVGSYRYEAKGGGLKAEGEDKNAASDPITFLSQNDALQNDTLKNKNGLSLSPQPSVLSLPSSAYLPALSLQPPALLPF